MREPKVLVRHGLRVRLPGDARRRAAAVATVDRRMALLEARRAAASPPATAAAAAAAAVPPGATGWRVTPDWILKPESPGVFVPRSFAEAKHEPSSGSVPSHSDRPPVTTHPREPEPGVLDVLFSSQESAASAAMLVARASHTEAALGSGRFVTTRRPGSTGKDLELWLLDSLRAVSSHSRVVDDDRVVIVWVERSGTGSEAASFVVPRVTQELLSRSHGRGLPGH